MLLEMALKVKLPGEGPRKQKGTPFPDISISFDFKSNGFYIHVLIEVKADFLPDTHPRRGF